MVKDFLALLRDGRVERGHEILAMADPGLVESVEEASRIGWLPAAPVVRLADRACTLLGPRPWRAVHHRVAGELVTRPLFRAFMQGMGAVYGTTPTAYGRLFPVVLQQAHRGFGTISSETRGETSVALRIDDCPSEGLSRGMLEVFAGTLEGLVSSVAQGVTVELAYVAGSRQAAIELRWIGEGAR
jgi:hypothetical protein